MDLQHVRIIRRRLKWSQSIKNKKFKCWKDTGEIAFGPYHPLFWVQTALESPALDQFLMMFEADS
jgi:hypothetical protein